MIASDLLQHALDAASEYETATTGTREDRAARKTQLYIDLAQAAALVDIGKTLRELHVDYRLIYGGLARPELDQ